MNRPMSASGQSKTIGDYHIATSKATPNTSGNVFVATNTKDKKKYAARKADRELIIHLEKSFADKPINYNNVSGYHALVTNGVTYYVIMEIADANLQHLLDQKALGN